MDLKRVWRILHNRPRTRCVMALLGALWLISWAWTVNAVMEHDPNAKQEKAQAEAHKAGHAGMDAHTPGDSPEHDHQAMPAAAAADPGHSVVGVKELLGRRLPPDIELIDAAGMRHTLKAVLDKPTILVLIYYRCPSACSLIQGNLAQTLNKVPSKLGREYQVISVSFDPEETMHDARKAKTNYTNIIRPQPDPAAWRFFTASAADIKRLTDAVGFGFKKIGPQSFLHPNVVAIVSTEGKIIRYLYGTDYLPFDVGMAVSEALKGTPGVSIKKILSYCFEYDPQKKGYAFKTIQIFGLIMLVCVGGFVFFLVKKSK